MKHHPYVMTTRARAYLSILGLRHFVIGAFLICAPHIFGNHSFDIIRRWLPLSVWGWSFLAVGVASPIISYLGKEVLARFFIIISLTISAFWGASFLAEVVEKGIQHGVSAPIWATLWLSLSLKDLVICAMPLRSPFEDYLAEEARRWQEGRQHYRG